MQLRHARHGPSKIKIHTMCARSSVCSAACTRPWGCCKPVPLGLACSPASSPPPPPSFLPPCLLPTPQYVARKVLVKKTADSAAAWVAANRSGPSQADLRTDLDRWLNTPAPPAHPAVAPAKPRRFFRRGAAPLTPADPTLRAGLAFLRDVLTRVAAGEEAVVARFARDDGSAGSQHVNVRAALGSLYGTAAGGRMVEALRDGGQDVALAGAIEEVYEELRTALRNDVIDLVVL